MKPSKVIRLAVKGGKILALAVPETECLAALGTARKRRASHIEPGNLALRLAFHSIRRLFGESGRIAMFTRSWQCLWRANMKPSGGGILPKLFTKRADAIAAEIQWLNQNLLTHNENH